MKKYKVAVEETCIYYYIVEANDEDEAMDIYYEVDHVSTKPKDDDILWVEEVKKKSKNMGRKDNE
jgi:hypothetical protein